MDSRADEIGPVKDTANRYVLPCGYYTDALVAPLKITLVGGGERHQVLSDEAVPSPIGHHVSDLDGPAFGGVGAFGNLRPLDYADGQDGPFGAALEQREKRSEHGESLPQNGALQQWSRCAPWIEAALEHAGGFYGIDDIRAEIEAGEALFWPGEKAAVVTQFWDFPKARAINFWLAGGDLTELRRMHDEISAWAKAQGCTHSIIAGRAGWSRALGYKPAWTAMSKELS